MKRLLCSFFIAAIIVAQSWAILGPHEQWPFGANVMFAYDADLEWPYYNIVFTIDDGNGITRPLNPPKDLGVADMILKHQFFNVFYGSTDAHYALGWRANDNPELFQLRMKAFWQLVAKSIRKNHGRTPHFLRIDVEQIQNSVVVATKKVGLFTDKDLAR